MHPCCAASLTPSAVPAILGADKFTQTYVNYVRDLPGGFQEWVENMTDQSHVAFAHHTVAGNRCCVGMFLPCAGAAVSGSCRQCPALTWC